MNTSSIKMTNSSQDEGISLLLDEKIHDFNCWRMDMKNLKEKIDISGRDFSGRNLSRAYLNGVSCIETNFSHSDLSKVNFAQSNLNRVNFEGANLTETICMYAEMLDCNLMNCNLTKTNLMWANLQNSNLTNCKMFKTILVEATLKNAKLPTIDKKGAYLKYAKLEGTSWKVEDNNASHH